MKVFKEILSDSFFRNDPHNFSDGWIFIDNFSFCINHKNDIGGLLGKGAETLFFN